MSIGVEETIVRKKKAKTSPDETTLSELLIELDSYFHLTPQRVRTNVPTTIIYSFRNMYYVNLGLVDVNNK